MNNCCNFLAGWFVIGLNDSLALVAFSLRVIDRWKDVLTIRKQKARMKR